MERIVWKGRIKQGCRDEYVRRHNEIWPEVEALFRKAGICNYTIFEADHELFGYYECRKGAEYANKIRAESPITAQWNTYMKDILEIEKNPETGLPLKFFPVYRMDE